MDHIPAQWTDELCWISKFKGKNWRALLMKIAFSETLYGIWHLRNDVCFENQPRDVNIGEVIVDTIVYRAWMVPRPKVHLGLLMIG